MVNRQGRLDILVNIASVYALFGAPRFAAYVSAKTGLVGLTRALAVELAPLRIQVNAILCGWVETDMTADLSGTPRAEEIRRRTPAGRWGRPDDVVGAAVFLDSAASEFVTGATLAVDGGYSVSERLLYE